MLGLLGGNRTFIAMKAAKHHPSILWNNYLGEPQNSLFGNAITCQKLPQFHFFLSLYAPEFIYTVLFKTAFKQIELH